jgi:hypothetical protein
VSSCAADAVAAAGRAMSFENSPTLANTPSIWARNVLREFKGLTGLDG